MGGTRQRGERGRLVRGSLGRLCQDVELELN